MDDKLARINDLIESVQEEIDQPIWADDEKQAMIDAQRNLDKVKKNVQRTDYNITFS